VKLTERTNGFADGIKCIYAHDRKGQGYLGSPTVSGYEKISSQDRGNSANSPSHAFQAHHDPSSPPAPTALRVHLWKPLQNAWVGAAFV
jgi:hypothetical protein